MNKFSKLLAIALLAGASAAQADIYTYKWSIDWDGLPDETGLFSVDSKGLVGDFVVDPWDPWFAPDGPVVVDVPPYIGPPEWFTRIEATFPSGALSYEGCDNYQTACGHGHPIWGDSIAVSFSTESPGVATKIRADCPGGPECEHYSPTWPDHATYETWHGVTTLTLQAPPITPIPEPSSFALLAVGLAAAGAARGVVRKKAA